MNQELQGIVEFLMGRARKHMENNIHMQKLYFIMRYPGKPQLVYSPIDTGIFFTPLFFQMLPMRVHSQWALKKLANEPGIELVSIMSFVTCDYLPRDPTTDLMHRSGASVMVYGVHTKDNIKIFQQFYQRTGTKIIWDPVDEETRLNPTGPGANLFPTDL